MYAMGELITEAMEDKGLQRRDLVKALGYTNHNKGRRNLDASIDEGDCSNEFIRQHLPLALGLTPAQVCKARELLEKDPEYPYQYEVAFTDRISPETGGMAAFEEKLDKLIGLWIRFWKAYYRGKDARKS
jgi:hypothetical protein